MRSGLAVMIVSCAPQTCSLPCSWLLVVVRRARHASYRERAARRSEACPEVPGARCDHLWAVVSGVYSECTWLAGYCLALTPHFIVIFLLLILRLLRVMLSYGSTRLAAQVLLRIAAATRARRGASDRQPTTHRCWTWTQFLKLLQI